MHPDRDTVVLGRELPHGLKAPSMLPARSEAEEPAADRTLGQLDVPAVPENVAFFFGIFGGRLKSRDVDVIDRSDRDIRHAGHFPTIQVKDRLYLFYAVSKAPATLIEILRYALDGRLAEKARALAYRQTETGVSRMGAKKEVSIPVLPWLAGKRQRNGAMKYRGRCENAPRFIEILPCPAASVVPRASEDVAR